MYSGIDIFKSQVFYGGICRSRILLDIREEEIVNSLNFVIGKDDTEKLMSIFKTVDSNISLFSYELYLDKLDRSLKLIQTGITDFEIIKKLILKNMDNAYISCRNSINR
jgi:hypothetical protein